VINTSETIWGPDAKLFNPSRHLPPAEGGSADDKLRAEQVKVPGTWGSILTFLGGTRNCIGYRFAIAEIKVILFILIRGLEFEELASKPKIEKKSA
jgi:cytochrome P450